MGHCVSNDVATTDFKFKRVKPMNEQWAANLIWPSLTGFYIFFSTDVCSQIKLEELGGGAKAPGNTFLLTCKASGFSVTDYGINWLRQATGKAPEWMGVQWGGGSIDYNAGLRSRITLSRNPSRNEGYLQVSFAVEGDSGTYFCAIRHASSTVAQSNWPTVQKQQRSG